VILTLTLPTILPEMTEAVVTAVLAGAGPLKPGAALFDLRVDLSEVGLQDCPPVSFYRIALREAAWLRRVLVDTNGSPAVGTVLAVFSSGPDDDLDQPPTRAVRHMVAGILSDTGAAAW